MSQSIPVAIRTILLIAFATFSMQVWGMDCSSSDISLSTQEQVDNFQATYGGGGICDRITGWLTVRDSSISNIDGLTSLTSIGGGLHIHNNLLLTDIDGLTNLTSIEKSLSITDNATLSNIDALTNISKINEDLTVVQNAILPDVDGLINVTSVGGDLNVSSPNMNMDGLTNVTSVGGNLHIYPGALNDPNALVSLQSIGGHLRLGCGCGLFELNGLKNLTSIGGQLEIRSVKTLSHINGLSNLLSAGSISIEQNVVLTDLDGLANLVSVVGLLGIYSNDALSNINGLSNLTSTGGLGIFDNDILTNVNGLSLLSSARGIGIGNNISLTNLDGLKNIIRFENLPNITSDLYIVSNTNLESCSALAPLLGWPDGPPDDNIGGPITVENNASGCNSVAEILASVTGPTAPEITSSETQNGYPILNFTPSTISDTLWTITGYKAQCLSDNASVFQNNNATPIPDESSIVSPLHISGVPFKNVDGLTIPVNITHPRTRHLTLTLTSPSGTSVMLWDEAVGTGTDLVGSFPLTLEPAESLEAFDGLNFNGEWKLAVADGVASQTGTLSSWGITIQDKVNVTTVSSPVTVTGLTNNQRYSCTVSAITGLGIGPASNAVPVIFTIDTFTVGGNVGGLTGTGLVLQNNAGDALSITGNDNFTFSTELDDGSDYAVTVKTQPIDPSQICGITNGSGTLAGSDITDVSVTCATLEEIILSDGFE